jgi:hypothetical protein
MRFHRACPSAAVSCCFVTFVCDCPWLSITVALRNEASTASPELSVFTRSPDSV